MGDADAVLILSGIEKRAAFGEKKQRVGAVGSESIVDEDIGGICHRPAVVIIDEAWEEEMVSSIMNVIDKWENDITIYPGHGDPATMKTVRKINLEFLEIVGDSR